MPNKSRNRLPARPRVRRGNQDDAEALRHELMRATVELFAEGGPQAVSTRAIAARVGVSPMTAYRYFADKSDLLSGLRAHIVGDLATQLRAATARVRGARARHRASIEAMLSYWEQRPDYFALFYGFSQASPRRDEAPLMGLGPVYAELLDVRRQMTQALADEIGAGMAHADLASGVRVAMEIGYLLGTMVVRRYPWPPTDQFRAAYVEQVQQAVERVLLHGETPAAPTQRAGLRKAA